MTMPPKLRLLLTIYLCCLGFFPVAIAQTPVSLLNKESKAEIGSKENLEAKEISVDELMRLQAQVQSEINRIENSPGKQFGAPRGTPEKELTDRSRWLKVTVFALQQRINTIREQADLKARASQIESRSELGDELPESPPYSILLVDRLRAELQNRLLALRSVENQIQIIDAMLENTRSSLTKTQSQERQAQERQEKAKPGENAEQAQWQYQLLSLEIRAGGEFLAKLLEERKTAEIRRSILRQEIEQSSRVIKRAEASVRFTESDMQSIHDRIVERRAKAQKQIETASVSRESAVSRVSALRQKSKELGQRLLGQRSELEIVRKDLAAAIALQKEEQEKNTGLLQKINPVRAIARSKAGDEVKQQQMREANAGKAIVATESEILANDRELALAEVHIGNLTTTLDLANNQLLALGLQLTFWELRYAVSTEENRQSSGLKKLYDGSRLLLTRLEPIYRQLQTQLELTLGLINDEERRRVISSDRGENAFRQQMLQTLNERQQLYLRSYGEIEELRQMMLRWVSEIEETSSSMRPAERLGQWLDRLGQWSGVVWQFEVFAVDDVLEVDGRKISATRSITVAKIVEAIAILVIGYLLAAWSSRLMVGKIASRFRIDATQARIARKWLLSVVLVVLLLVSLAVVKIPLAAFAFLGGAVAIGAGFGMQTLLKNLICGLMLLIERPFRPGDIVEVGTIRGEITDINVRSCTIRDINGIETLIPNSTFIEQNVTNWTLSSRHVRHNIKVGVAYGAPLQEAIDLLLDIARKNPAVLKLPTPEALLEEFGDNSQTIGLYIWLEIGPAIPTSRQVLSDLRLKIAEVFSENSIAIAFPQRDVHLDVTSPLKIELAQQQP